MIKQMWFYLVTIAVIIVAAGMPQPVAAQAADTVPRVLAAVNAARIENSLPPYQLNSLLTLSAQRHSEYQASIGSWTHSSADGGRTLQRALAVGYPATRANENVYSGRVTPEEAVHWWYTADADHRNNVLHPVMREIGIGAAPDADGTIYYTMDISAQPNVLPVFINSGAYSTNSPSVTLTLTNEQVFGSAAGRIGPVSQVMISNSPDFSNATQQGFAQWVPWTLDSAGAGQKTVYVRFFDPYGQTADSKATIVLDPSGAGAPPPPPAQPTSAPVVPTSVPPTAVPQQPQQPSRPQPTAAPLQPTSLPPTDTPPGLTPTGAAVAMIGAPTLDYSDSQYMRAKRGEIFVENLDENGQPAGPVSEITLRQALWLALMFGIALISIGFLRLRAFQRASRTVKETAADGDD
jgi:hypothetical protein